MSESNKPVWHLDQMAGAVLKEVESLSIDLKNEYQTDRARTVGRARFVIHEARKRIQVLEATVRALSWKPIDGNVPRNRLLLFRAHHGSVVQDCLYDYDEISLARAKRLYAAWTEIPLREVED